MANKEDIALIAHLMRRAGFGATYDELEAYTAKGYEATLEELLRPEDKEPVDRYEMLRYHPWSWKPGTIQGTGHAPCCDPLTRIVSSCVASIPLTSRLRSRIA